MQITKQIKTNFRMTESKLIAVGGFLIKDNQILLALRQQTSYENGYYGLIGGRVENGETVHQALIREIYEEVGVAVKYEDMKLAHIISFKRGNGNEIISFDFIVNNWQGEPINKEPHKHAHVKWFSLDNLPENFINRHKTAYECYQKGVYYSSYGY